ncbi:DNRLRE domain-containing protein [Sorangium sp. So ce861]|uniref:DNRLRE domain-containing protein n=1 Tax=Sorangium sp. So ce861 TaxID=3133323 RepID=UPI003F61FC3B
MSAIAFVAGCSSGSPGEELHGTAKLAAGSEDPTCVTIQRGTAGAVEDATIWETFPTWSDSTVLLRTGTLTGFGVRHAVLRFDLSPVPAGANVVSATLRLEQIFRDTTSSSTINIHRILSPWTESTVTWQSLGNGSDFDPAIAASLQSLPGVGIRSADLTSLTAAWLAGTVPNNGVLLEEAPVLTTSFPSSEEPTVSRRPSLEVCYTTATNCTGTLDDGDACTTDTCDPVLGILHTPISTDDSDPSTIDTCDPATGAVTHVACPALDPTLPTRLIDAVGCIYQGPNAPQTGVTATIDPASVAVVKGKVATRAGVPISGVKVSVLHHGAGSAESFGQVLTRADGDFELVVRGGQPLTMKYEKAGYLPVQRQVGTQWQRWSEAPDVVLIEGDPVVTPVALGSATGAQIARGSVQTDESGTRQATLLFPSGTTGTMTVPDPSGPPGATMTVALPAEVHVRATEYTVGPNGPEAMPGTLPPTSGYTYAVELGLDEAVAAGATKVEFNQPIPFYVDNFLDFPIGMHVPLGYYDAQKGAWVPADDGRVIDILDVIGGLASVDIDGDGAADDASELAALGITAEELQQLAGQYTPGTSFWRSLVTHFTPWDCNWPYGAPPDAESPPGGPDDDDGDGDGDGGGDGDGAGPDDPSVECGSIIECESQALGESFPITGTPFSLHYKSDRTAGRNRERYRIEIPLTRSAVPPSLERIDFKVSVAGRVFDMSVDCPCSPDQQYTFEWDGRDAFGRVVPGVLTATVEINYVYKGFYYTPAAQGMVSGGGGSGGGGSGGGGPRSFGASSDVILTGNRTRQEVFVGRRWETALGGWFNGSPALGGLSLSAHHGYDPNTSTIYLGDGRRRTAHNMVSTVRRVAGAPPPPVSSSTAEGVRADSVRISRPAGIAVGPDGSIYYSESNNNSRIRKISPDGLVSTVAGVYGQFGYNGDNQPATQAHLYFPEALALAPDGSLYLLDTFNERIRKVSPDGIITTVVGNGATGTLVPDGAIATSGPLDSQLVQDMAVSSDGTLYLAFTKKIRKVAPDGVITTVAGSWDNPSSNSSGDGGPAVQARFAFIRGMALGPDGDIYVSDSHGVTHSQLANRIRRINRNGIITTIAGTDGTSTSNDGAYAISSSIGVPGALAVGPDGSVYFAAQSVVTDPVTGNQRTVRLLRRITTAGLLTTVVGNNAPFAAGCSVSPCGFDGPATATWLRGEVAVAVAPDGSLIYLDVSANDSVIGRAGTALPGITDADIVIASDDGAEVYIFDARGKHLATADALLGAVTYEFGYDAAGRLSTITDVDEQVTTIQRDANGDATAIVAPTGQSTSLAYDAEGYLWTVTNPANETTTLLYYPDSGLLQSLQDPLGRLHEFEFDAEGRLIRDENPASGYKELTRTKTANGHRVTITTAMGLTRGYEIATLPDGSTQRIRTASDGLSTVEQTSTSGTRTITSPDGTVVSVEVKGDPRFGMQAPILSKKTTTTPLGRTRQVTGARSLTLSDPNNSFSLTSMTDTITVNGRQFTQVFNRAASTVATTLPSGRRVTTTLTPQGRVGSVTLPGISPVAFAYYPDGRLHTLSQGSRTWSYTYEDGWLTSATDPLLRTEYFINDPIGRTTQVTRADDEIIGMSYNPGGSVYTVTPPDRPAHTFNYTPADLLDEYDAPDAGSIPTTTSWSYDLDHMLTGSTRPGEPASVYTREPVTGLLSQVTLPLGLGSIALAYHPTTGNLESLTGPSGISLGFGYDGILMTSRTWTGTGFGSGASTVAWAYDNDLRINSETVNGVAATSFGYDVDGFLNHAGGLTLHRHAQNGLYTGSSAGIVSDTVTPDADGGVQSYVAQAAGTVLYQVNYTPDALGRIDQLTETIQGETRSYDYEYDLAGRLTDVFRDGVLTAHYDYDANGNRLARTSSTGTEGGTYDDQDRLLSYGTKTYGMSPAGDRTSVTDAVTGGTTAFTYDASGNLRHVELPDGTDIDYLVDGEAHRIWKQRNGVNVQGFLYRSDLQPAAELDGAGGVVARFVYGRGRNLPDLMIKGGATYRILTDHLGSPRLVVDVATGVVAQRMDFDEFGRVLLDTNPGFTPFGFAGGIYDRDTGLVRFGVRDYDPEAGRWTAKDPLGFGGGDTNVYGYCSNDPVNYIDMDGRNPLVALGLAVLFILEMGMAAPSDTADAPADILAMGVAISGMGAIAAEATRVAGVCERAGAEAMEDAARACFPAGTPVRTTEGHVSIDEIEVGDAVWSYDASSDTWGWARVERTFVHDTAGELVHLEGSGELLQATRNHPFCVLSGEQLWGRRLPAELPVEEATCADGGRWVEAQDVLPGDVLVRADDASPLVVSSLMTAVGPRVVYNFEVVGAHTYTVGTTDVLVHNKAMPRAFKRPKARVSGKEGAKDVPGWAKGNRPYQDESGKEFAERLLNEKYGPGNYDKGPGSEFNQIRKWGDRAFE